MQGQQDINISYCVLSCTEVSIKSIPINSQSDAPPIHKKTNFYFSLTFCLLQPYCLIILWVCRGVILSAPKLMTLTQVRSLSLEAIVPCCFADGIKGHAMTRLIPHSLILKREMNYMHAFFCVWGLAVNDQLSRRIVSIGEINNCTPENSIFLGFDAVSVGLVRPEDTRSKFLWNVASCLYIDNLSYLRKTRFLPTAL